MRSEKALKLAIAVMYVQGVSTRKVAAITKEICGLDLPRFSGRWGREGLLSKSRRRTHCQSKVTQQIDERVERCEA